MKEAVLFNQFTGGLNTKVRPHQIAPNEMRSIIGMDFTANSLARSLGYTKLGTETDNTLTGKTLYRHSVLAGQDVLIKQIGTIFKYYDEVDDTWYKITNTTVTANTRWSFMSFNGYAYGNNGIDNWFFWRGSARSTVVGTVSIGATTIDLATGHGGRFPASGTIMIRDMAITYSGVSTDQLTGVSGVTAEIPSGSTVILQADLTTYPSTPKARQIVFFKNRSYMIDYATPTIIRHSKLADNTNPETDLVNFTIAGSGAGDAGFGIAPDEVVGMVVASTGGSNAILLCSCKDGKIYSFTVVDTAGSPGTTVNAFVPIRTMGSYARSWQLFAEMENDIAMIDQYGHVRTLGYGDVNTPIKVQSISSKIEPTLQQINFMEGTMEYHRRILYCIGRTPDAGSNNITMVFDTNYGAWSSKLHWDVSCLAKYEDDLVGLSAVTGDVWKLNDTYSVYINDATDGFQGQYYSEAVTGDIEFGEPLKYKEIMNMRLDGLITTNTQAYIDIFFDNGSAPFTFLVSGNNTDIIIAEDPNVAVGTIVFGEGVFNGGLPSSDDRKEFFCRLQFKNTIPFIKLSIRIRIDQKDTDFELSDLSIYARLKGEDYFPKKFVLKQVS